MKIQIFPPGNKFLSKWIYDIAATKEFSKLYGTPTSVILRDFVHCHYKFVQNIISYFSFYIFDVIYIYIHKVQKCLSKVSILSRCVLRCKYRSCRLFPSVLKISFMCHKLVMFNVQCKLERVRPWYGHCILHLSKCLYQHK